MRTAIQKELDTNTDLADGLAAEIGRWSIRQQKAWLRKRSAARTRRAEGRDRQLRLAAPHTITHRNTTRLPTTAQPLEPDRSTIQCSPPPNNPRKLHVSANEMPTTTPQADSLPFAATPQQPRTVTFTQHVTTARKTAGQLTKSSARSLPKRQTSTARPRPTVLPRTRERPEETGMNPQRSILDFFGTRGHNEVERTGIG